MNYQCTYCLTIDFDKHFTECPRGAIARAVWDQGFEDGIKRRPAKSRDPSYNLGWRIGLRTRERNEVECGHEPGKMVETPLPAPPAAKQKAQLSLF